MIISLSWIRDFVELPKQFDVHDIANNLTLSTAEVEEVKTTNEHFKKIKAVKVLSLKKHPQAEKLNLVTFTDGEKNFEVVCGAPNVTPGIIVPFAAVGTTLPGNFTLEAKSIRGVMSEGMLCSAKELGLGNDQAGLLILNEKTKIGETLDKALGIVSDELIEIDNKSLTHRPDLWGMYGFARELITILNLKWKKYFDESWKKNIESFWTNQKAEEIFKINTKHECLSFYAIKIENIDIKPSPDWLITRLESCGIRAINNVVDITNYVMLELGLPLHAYDSKKVDGHLNIQTQSTTSEMILLDGKKISLLPGDVVIIDGKSPLVLAGIMGGQTCGVTDQTKSLILEAAVWESSRIRTTATRLGLRTDASSRFEKSLDPVSSYEAFLRAIELIKQLIPTAKISKAPQIWTAQTLKSHPIQIDVDPLKIQSLLGKQIPVDHMKNLLINLGFKIEENKNQWKLNVPSFRATKDISILEDIVEEIGRLVGYGEIPVTSPLVEVSPVQLNKKKLFERQLQNFLTYQSKCFEVMTYPLIGASHLKQSQWSENNQELILVNSISEDADRMRPSLIPTMIEVLSLNAKNFDYFRFFELGRTYSAKTWDKVTENLDLLLAFSGITHQGKELVDTVEAVFRFLKLPLEIKFSTFEKLPLSRILPNQWNGIHPNECASINSMGQIVGYIFTVHPSILKNYKIKHHTHLALIDTNTLWPRAFEAKTKYKPLTYLQATYFDCCVAINNNSLVEEPVKVVEKLKIPEVSNVKVFDVFQRENEPKYVTIRSHFNAVETELDASKIKILETTILDSLKKAGFFLRQ